MLCARSINPLERGRPVCGARGCYANSMMGRSGLEIGHGRARGAPGDTWSAEAGCGGKSLVKKVVDEAERIERSDGKA